MGSEMCIRDSVRGARRRDLGRGEGRGEDGGVEDGRDQVPAAAEATAGAEGAEMREHWSRNAVIRGQRRVTINQAQSHARSRAGHVPRNVPARLSRCVGKVQPWKSPAASQSFLGAGGASSGRRSTGAQPSPSTWKNLGWKWSSYGFGRLIWMPPTRMSFPVPNLVLTMRSSFSLMQSYATSVAALIGSSHDLQYCAFGPAEQRGGAG